MIILCKTFNTSSKLGALMCRNTKILHIKLFGRFHKKKHIIGPLAIVLQDRTLSVFYSLTMEHTDMLSVLTVYNIIAV